MLTRRSPRRRVPVLALAPVLVLAGCAGSSSPTATPTTAATTATSAPGAATSAPATTGAAIRIVQFSYHPSPLTVSAGAKVEVTNSDSATHTVTSDLAGLFKADDVSKGTPVTFTAPSRAGTYTFHCDYHPSMHGTLVVR